MIDEVDSDQRLTSLIIEVLRTRTVLIWFRIVTSEFFNVMAGRGNHQF